MMKELTTNTLGLSDKKELIVDSLDYRELHVDFYEDPVGKQYYTIINDVRLDFGIDNTLYADDVKKLIDDQLDTITRFEEIPEYTGARLTWFDNGGFRDIKLIHWNRLLKIYLVVDPDKVNINSVKSDALNILNKLLKKEN